jgi:hypothetical protein
MADVVDQSWKDDGEVAPDLETAPGQKCFSIVLEIGAGEE